MKKSKPFNTVVSVDWDYFLPMSIDGFDWGHDESNALFYEFLWSIRAGNHVDCRQGRKLAVDVIRVAEERVLKFWDSILAPDWPLSIAVTDSHKHMADLCAPFKSRQDSWTQDVINFDAHHDWHYGHKAKKRSDVNCGNWAEYLSRVGAIGEYTVVYPEWRKKTPESGGAPQEIKRHVRYGWGGEPIKAARVFLCRSSCWMPSWCDDMWMLLLAKLKERGADMLFTQDFALTPRNLTLEQAIQAAKESEAQRESYLAQLKERKAA